MRTAWKVFSKISNKKIYSVTVIRKALIRYKRGRKNYAPNWLREMGYHPLVFRTKKHALLFSKILPGTIVEKVEIGKKMPLPVMCDTTALDKGKIIPDAQLGLWPEGTMMVEWVKPFKEEKAK